MSWPLGGSSSVRNGGHSLPSAACIPMNGLASQRLASERTSIDTLTGLKAILIMVIAVPVMVAICVVAAIIGWDAHTHFGFRDADLLGDLLFTGLGAVVVGLAVRV